MRVGIKYCGGCNPTYTREDVEGELREILGEQNVVYTSKCKDVDVLIVICGCKTACALRDVEGCTNVLLIDEFKNRHELAELLSKNFSP